ncbi:hypothetical protein TREMEDRAFT_56833 [Tremella mesenterica DSM 1558]|uniref:uncharacterized protein n=1 Tax=Tremella mesenterica (strain ATCC 24925 / CBS 8224 / DSM 1558 / NBRC 9311 / NRRL Y-6157 / RJB 2259-6 / UBC 559-6) TaxID=578456 RepID=UPI0003F4979E|nr:uncharacterized protein TREMEDRAFT_56833 [Tremella mesenterica DSM 1558]EIW70158.1 hypothetical protein TREMEDRAFT_56833 [Tremella mesenterica DSM 1558]
MTQDFVEGYDGRRAEEDWFETGNVDEREGRARDQSILNTKLEFEETRLSDLGLRKDVCRKVR